MSGGENLIFSEFYEGQGLGNQLWVYAASRSIAEYLSVPFAIRGMDRFKGSNFLNIDTTVGITENQADALISRAIENKSIQNFLEISYYDPDLDYFSSAYDGRVKSLNGIVKLDGLFQSEKYFFGNLEKLKRYFVVKSEYLLKNYVHSDTAIINLRGGEYKRHKSLILPETYWTNAIENLSAQTGIDRFLVVSDDKPYAKALFPRYEIYQGGIADCYATICNAENLILSNSSFAYFPIKTGGNAKTVIAPQHWARFGNPHKRWASVANCYEGWLWQDIHGALKSYELCLPEIAATEMLYESTYSVHTTQRVLLKKPLRSVVPQSIRSAAKKVLSLFFPKLIG